MPAPKPRAQLTRDRPSRSELRHSRHGAGGVFLQIVWQDTITCFTHPILLQIQNKAGCQQRHVPVRSRCKLLGYFGQSELFPPEVTFGSYCYH